MSTHPYLQRHYSLPRFVVLAVVTAFLVVVLTLMVTDKPEPLSTWSTTTPSTAPRVAP